MLSNSISEGKTAYQAEYEIAGDRAIGSVTLFGSKLRNFNVKVRNKKFIVHEISKDEHGFKTHLSFNVEHEFQGNQTLLEKAMEHVSDYASQHPTMSPEDIARIAISYYIERMN